MSRYGLNLIVITPRKNLKKKKSFSEYPEQNSLFSHPEHDFELSFFFQDTDFKMWKNVIKMQF